MRRTNGNVFGVNYISIGYFYHFTINNPQTVFQVLNMRPYRDDKRTNAQEMDDTKTLSYKNGTVVFFNGSDYMSRCIESATFTYWSHVAICINMSSQFKHALYDTIDCFKRLKNISEDHAKNSILPLFDEFGVTNEIGATLEALKTEFLTKNLKKIPSHTSIAKHVESLNVVSYLPSSTNAHAAWPKEKCVQFVLVALNNALYEPNDNRIDKAKITDWFEGELGGSKISKNASIPTETTVGNNNKKKISLDAYGDVKVQLLNLLLEDKLSVLRDYEIVQSTKKKNNGNNIKRRSEKIDGDLDALLGVDDSKVKTKTFKPNALLHHVVQLLEAATFLKSTNMGKKIQEELALQEPHTTSHRENRSKMQRPIHTYMWESTTGTDIHCMDELTGVCKEGVKLTMLINRLQDYDGIVSSRHISSKQELYRSYYRSYDRSESAKSSSLGASPRKSPRSPRQMSAIPLSSLKGKTSIYTHKNNDDLLKSTSRISITTQDDSGSVVTRFIRTPRRFSSASERDDYAISLKTSDSFDTFTASSLLTSGRDDSINTEHTRSASIYKGMVCNMLINHGKSYQSGVGDFARAWFLDFCCRCSCSSQTESLTTAPDTYLNNLHEPTENDDFYCSELVYQTLMDIKLYQTLDETNTQLVSFFEGHFDSTKMENLLRLTLSDFDTAEDYYAFLTAYAILLLYNAGSLNYIKMLGLLGPSKDKEISEKSMDGKSLTVTTCMITPSKLYDLDIQLAIGIPLEHPTNLYKLEESKSDNL